MQFTRESVFVGAIRAFCTAFAALLGVLIAIVIVFIALSSLGHPDLLPPASEVTIAPDAEGNRYLLPSSSPAIVRLDFHGIIGEGDLTASHIEDILLDSRESLLANDRVKALLLHMDTPGGTVTDADGIYRAILNYKEKHKVPVYAFVDGMCASGGMYIASACDKIFATPSSVVGSIGVIVGPTFNFSQIMEKWGIQSLTLTEGKDKDMLNPFRPWIPGEDASLRAIIADLYEQFVDILVEARPNLDKQKLIDIYGAQIFLAPKAHEFGYIDQGNSNYTEALTALSKAAGIEGEEKYQVFQLTPHHGFLAGLADAKASILQGKITHIFQVGPNNLSSELSGKLLYLYLPSQ